MIIGEKSKLEERIAERGFVTGQEPASGSGAMIIALAHEMREMGINYQKHLHVTAVDVNPKCVQMSYLQFSLLHIPAIVIHGNSLPLEEFGCWYMPAHILDGWSWKLWREPEPDAEQEILHVEPVEKRPDGGRKREWPGDQLTLF